MMESYPKIQPYRGDGSLNFITCPKLDTAVLEQLGLHRDGTFQIIDNFAVLPADYLCPKAYSDGLVRKTEYTISIHHHAASWIPREDIEKRNAWWREQRREHLRYAPNRFIRKVFGDEAIDRLKRILGK